MRDMKMQPAGTVDSPHPGRFAQHPLQVPGIYGPFHNEPVTRPGKAGIQVSGPGHGG